MDLDSFVVLIYVRFIGVLLKVYKISNFWWSFLGILFVFWISYGEVILVLYKIIIYF